MIINTVNLTKTYKYFTKDIGLMGSIKSLFKRKYSYKKALNNFNLEVFEGEFLGIIGPNGAGKTTLIKMLTGIIAPTSGNISVLGYYPNKLQNEFKKQYSVVMGQKSQLFFDLTPNDTFLLFREIYDIPLADFTKNVDYLVNLFDVTKLRNVLVRTMSLGERMKMELIVALLHKPKILFLDEPTIGLDAIAQRQIRNYLKEVNETMGTTIILTSHYMDDIRSLCKRCLVINNGEKIYDGSCDELFIKYQTHKVITFCFADRTEIELPDNCTILEKTDHKISFMVDKNRAQSIISSLITKYSLSDVSIEEEEIGSIVERIYNDRQLKVR